MLQKFNFPKEAKLLLNSLDQMKKQTLNQLADLSAVSKNLRLSEGFRKLASLNHWPTEEAQDNKTIYYWQLSRETSHSLPHPAKVSDFTTFKFFCTEKDFKENTPDYKILANDYSPYETVNYPAICQCPIHYYCTAKTFNNLLDCLIAGALALTESNTCTQMKPPHSYQESQSQSYTI